jgi:hypothetical protein
LAADGAERARSNFQICNSVAQYNSHTVIARLDRAIHAGAFGPPIADFVSFSGMDGPIEWGHYGNVEFGV